MLLLAALIVRRSVLVLVQLVLAQLVLAQLALALALAQLVL